MLRRDPYPPEIFDRAQHLLKRNGRSGGANVRNRHGALLKGLVRCVACDCTMVPSHTMKHLAGKGSKVYRYYCCANAREHGWSACPAPSVPAPELELFVVDQIKAIGRDPALLDATLAECRRQREEAIGKLEVEKRALERELRRHDAELRRLVDKEGAPADRLVDVQDAIRRAECRATEVREQILALSRELVDAREVGEACAQFDPLWETLSAREQARILHLLIERVDYDGPKGTVAITFHPTGIKTLADELNEKEPACKA